MNPDIHPDIDAALADLERQHGLRILFAVESGSRAWGFESADSDWDVRAVAARPVEAYLRLAKDGPDTWSAMLPGDLDIVVWDVRKAAAHWARSNAAITEWFGSPIVYRDAQGWLARFRDAARGAFLPETAAWHYASMWAKAVDRAGGLSPRMPLKPLCYALRANACARWAIERRTMPPTRFADTLDGLGIPDDLRAAIRDLVARKSTAAEWDTADIPPSFAPLLADLRPTIRATDWTPSPDTLSLRHSAASALERLFQETVLSPPPA